MKKIFENKPRLIFWVGFYVVLMLMIVGVIVGLGEKDVSLEYQEDEKQIAVLTSEEIRENLDKVHISGAIEEVSTDRVVVRSSDDVASYNITEETVLYKGVMAQEVSLESLKVGQMVSLQVSESTKNIISIWWGG